MPPRKKTKASAASTPLTETQPKTPQDSGSIVLSQDHELLNDPWSDDQETQLFKSMMKWKPTGIHKHFRMISIHNDMRSHGFASDDVPHTRIPGIWRKLHQLYDLRALDDRENAYIFHDEPDPLDPDDAENMPGFELPEDDFGQLIWQKRFHGPDSAAGSSPPLMPVDDDKALFQPGLGLLKDLPGSVRSQKAESVADAATPTPKNAKSTRSSRAAAKNTKGTKAVQTAKKGKVESVVSDSTEEDDDEDGDEESSSESEEDNTAPSTRRTNRSAARAKPAPKRTRKR